MNWKNTFHQLPHTQDDILPQLMLTHLSSWGAIIMTGEDKKTYLQGQVTCNVVTLQPDQSTWGAHCDPKGKVWSLFRLFHHHGGYAMIQPRSAIESEYQELKKYAVFSQVNIEQSPDIVMGVIGQSAQEYIDQLTSDQDQLNLASGNVRAIKGGTAVKISEQRWLLLLGGMYAQNLVSTFTGDTVDESVWTKFEIEDASPLVTASEQCQHIPQAFNLQAIDGICFTKGCYTGQETIARAKYRGMNKRAMYIVRGNVNSSSVSLFSENMSFIPKTPITLERAVGDNWRAAGHLLASYMFSDHQAIGLIILPNNLEEDTPLRIASQPETHWSIQPLPYTLHEDD